jgi:hypothetical protein
MFDPYITCTLQSDYVRDNDHLFLEAVLLNAWVRI